VGSLPEKQKPNGNHQLTATVSPRNVSKEDEEVSDKKDDCPE
jgi:hypothetical protein